MPESEKTPQVVLLCGVSGSGKTYRAGFYERLGYVRLSLDSLVWERYGPTLGTLAPEKQREVFAACFEELAGRLAQLLGEGRRVVVDSTLCSRGKRDRMRQVCRACGADVRLEYLEVPLEVLVERLSHRRGTGPDDQIVTEAQIRRFVSGFEKPQGEGELKLPNRDK